MSLSPFPYMTDHHFPFSNQHLRALKGPLSDFKLGWQRLACWHATWHFGTGFMALEPELEHTHRQTLSSQQDPPLRSPEAVIGGRSWLRGDLASINRHTERLPCLEHKQWEGPSAAGGHVLLLNPSETWPKNLVDVCIVYESYLVFYFLEQSQPLHHVLSMMI